MDAQKLGEFIKEQRTNLSMTQKQLASEIHVTPQAISKWERGLGLPDIENIEALANAFHLSRAEILECRIEQQDTNDDYIVDNVLDETLALVRDNKKQTKKEFCKIVIGMILGVIILGTAIRFRIYPMSWISSSDGSTAYFMSGFMSVKYVIAIALLGASILGLSVYKFFKLMIRR